MPEYAVLKTAHARFHQAAANVVAKAESGKSVAEDVALGADSEYGKASSAVVCAILDMRHRAAMHAVAGAACAATAAA
jgi:hypothetical protein